MSFGKSSGQSTTNQQQTSTQALDPDIKSALLSNYGNLSSNVPNYTPYSGTTVANLTPDQLQAFGLVGNIVSGNVGAAAVNNGITATQGVAGFTPQQVSLTGNQAVAGQINPTTVSTVNPSLVGNMSLTPYLNPYTSNVINATSAAANNALQQENNQADSAATLAGAWRGNALAVTQGVNDAQSNIGLANTIANLENTNYQTALGTATSDANRQLAASQGNQQTQLAEGTTNAGLTTQASLANAANALTAQQSNQQAGIAGAGLNLQAGQQLGALGTEQLTNALTGAQALDSAGTQQQQQDAAQLQWAYQNNYLNAQQYAIALQQLRNQTLGLAGNPTLTQSQGTSNQQSTNSSGNLSLAGASAGGITL